MPYFPTPTTAEELESKVVDYMTRLEERRVLGEVPPQVFSIAAQAIWFVTSGLVREEVSHMLSVAAGQSSDLVTHRVFCKAGAANAVMSQPTTGSGLMVVIGGVVTYSNHTTMGADREATKAKIIAGLAEKGFQELDSPIAMGMPR